MANTPFGDLAWESEAVKNELSKQRSSRVYELCTLKKIGNNYQFVHHKHAVKVSGWEPRSERPENGSKARDSPAAEPSIFETVPFGEEGEEGEASPSEKAACNVRRARRAVYELAACNPWEYFATLTLDAAKYDRFDLCAFRKNLAQFLRNFNRKQGKNVKYLLIPEKHQDGAWHMHGFFMGIPGEELTPFVAGVHPQKLIDGGYLNWKKLEKRFGFVSFGAVQNLEAAASYAAKYVTKNVSTESMELGRHLYFASQGLARATTLFRGRVSRQLGADGEPSWDWSGEWCDIKKYESLDEFTQEWYAESVI